MERRSRSYPQSYMPYGREGYGDDQAHVRASQRRQQYGQPAGMDDQQYLQASDEPKQFMDWTQTFTSQTPAYSNQFFHTARGQSAVDQDFDLGALSADPRSVENIDLNSLTTPAEQSWRPPGFSQFREVAPGFQRTTQASGNGAMPEPLPDQLAIIDVGSDGASNVDSAYMTANPSSQAANWNCHGITTGLQSTGTRSAYDLSQSSSTPTNPGTGRPVSANQLHKTTPRKRRQSSDLLPPCQHCDYQPKNRSDGQKHANKHFKPFKCTFPECAAKDVGFATPNDLDRHQRSGKHNMPPTKGSGKGYVCVACPTAPENKPKWWPRLDNFKAHVGRRHKNWELSHLVRASECDARPVDSLEDTSTYFSGHSLADQDYYQQPETISQTTNGQLSSQGETISWPDHNATLPSIDELLGVGIGMGEDQHPADEFAGRQCGSAGANQSYGDDLAGLSLLGTAAQMSSSSFLRPDEPSSQVAFGNDTQSKRSSDDGWEQSSAKREHKVTFSQDHPNMSDSQVPIRCRFCNKALRRQCDLKKHEKRHSRPYGCTMPRCFIKQGSRSDWKRHEEKQHGIQESWKCTLPDSSGKPCHANFYTWKLFEQHLNNAHRILASQDTQNYRDGFLLGRGGHRRFWCGFCNKVVKNEHQRTQTAKEFRFAHIGNHFDSDRKDINEYVCLELRKPFGEITREEKKQARDDFNKPSSADDDDGLFSGQTVGCGLAEAAMLGAGYEEDLMFGYDKCTSSEQAT